MAWFLGVGLMFLSAVGLVYLLIGHRLLWTGVQSWRIGSVLWSWRKILGDWVKAVITSLARIVISDFIGVFCILLRTGLFSNRSIGLLTLFILLSYMLANYCCHRSGLLKAWRSLIWRGIYLICDNCLYLWISSMNQRFLSRLTAFIWLKPRRIFASASAPQPTTRRSLHILMFLVLRLSLYHLIKSYLLSIYLLTLILKSNYYQNQIKT